MMEPWTLATTGAAALVVVVALLRVGGLRAQRALLALEPPAPPAPVPRARVRRAARPRELAAVRAPSTWGRDVLVEAQIEHDGDTFRLRPLQAGADLPLGEELVWAALDPHAVATRSAIASRAHALLCDRLSQHGWEPCRRGPAWYAHRYRRRLAPPT